MNKELEANTATLTIDNDKIYIGIPFVKTDVKNRTVEGFATLDNIDRSGEIVDADASRDAFSEWPGNIREMHQKKAVGKAVAVIEKPFIHSNGESYNGIWVKARISKGAPDTWEKILDGTLTGFSVGGAVLEKKNEMAKDSGRSVSRVTKYRLSELSVVDSPCNHLAAFSLVKSLDGDFWAEDPIDDLEDGEEFEKVDLSTAGRKVEAKSGIAESDGSFPIDDAKSLQDAIDDWGRAGSTESDKAHIISRAQELKLTNKLPKGWIGGEKSVEKNETIEDLEKAAPKHKLDDGDPAAHLDNAYNEVQNYTDHVRAGNDNDKDSHAAHAMDVAGNIARLKERSQQRGGYVPPAHPMAKGEDLQENVNSDISISDEERGLFKKFISLFKGLDKEVTPVIEKIEPDKKIEKVDGGDTSEMTEETLREVLGESLGGLTKSVDEKLDGITETLVKTVDEKIATLATSESLDELKKSLEDVTGRVVSLEESGAIKKSGDGVAAGEEKLEKSDGFWSDTIVPSYFKKGLGG